MARCRRRALLIALCTLAGCGGGVDRPNADVTIVLDGEPNGTHAGFYVALQRGFDDAEGVRFMLRRPGRTDPLLDVAAERADFAVASIEALGRARNAGTKVVGVLAIVQEPTAALIARPGVDRPRDLAGAPVAAADRRLLRAGLGGTRVRRVAPGADPVAGLLDGTVEAVLGTWPVEGAAAQDRRSSTSVLRYDTLGAPRHPGLLLVARETTVADEPEIVRATATALARAIAFAQVDRESAVQDMRARVRSLDAEVAFAQLDAVASAFTQGAPAFGALNEAELRAWSAWAVESGVLEAPVDVTRAFTLAPPPP